MRPAHRHVTQTRTRATRPHHSSFSHKAQVQHSPCHSLICITISRKATPRAPQRRQSPGMPSRKSALRWHATPEVEAQHIHTVEQAEALAALPSATAVEVSAVHNKCASRKRAQVHDGLREGSHQTAATRVTRSASDGCGIQSVLLCDKDLDRIVAPAWWVMEHLF